MSVDTWLPSLANACLQVEKPSSDRWATPGDLAKALEPRTVQTPALDLIDAQMVKIANGEIDRQIICMPPQEGKSTRVTITTPLWMLTRNPRLRIPIVSFQQELANDFGSAIRNLIMENAGQEGTLDLGLRIAPDNGSSRDFQLDNHVGRIRSVGLGGGLTGRAADALFIDDPISNMEQAQSRRWRDRGWNFWQSVGSTRLAPGAPVVVVLTRWHEDDLAGRLLAAEDGHRWNVLSIPAIAESPDDPLGRPVGVAMDSARGARDWESIRVTSGEYVWAALYQQRPAPAEGGLFKRANLKHWTHCPEPSLRRPAILVEGREVYLETIWKFLTVDLAASLKTGADFTVAAVWGQTMDGNLILLDGLREHLDPSMHWDKIKQLRTKWDAGTVYLEPAAFGTTMVYEASTDGVPIEELKPDKDKLTRALPAAARADAGRLFIPATTTYSWVQDWVDELAAFPNGAHDDIVDVLAYAARVAATHWVPQQSAEVERAYAPKRDAEYVDLMAANF